MSVMFAMPKLSSPRRQLTTFHIIQLAYCLYSCMQERMMEGFKKEQEKMKEEHKRKQEQMKEEHEKELQELKVL